MRSEAIWIIDATAEIGRSELNGVVHRGLAERLEKAFLWVSQDNTSYARLNLFNERE